MAGFLRKLMPKRFRKDGIVIPVVKLQGAIISGGGQFRPALNLASVAPMLEKAFSVKDAPAVAITINSPGGSPVQSRLIFTRIRELAREKQKKVLVFVEDVAASGGYMIALAGDEIIADPTSIVGSIGVVSGGFGFPELLKKIGVERRVYTAGEHKVMLDPFQPEKPEDVARLQAIQREIHKNFIDLVRSRRGARLTGPEKTLFSGEYWVASTALGYGLIDRLGELRSVLRERYGEDVLMPVVAASRGLFGRLAPATGSSELAARPGLAEEVVSAIEARALWARFGL